MNQNKEAVYKAPVKPEKHLDSLGQENPASDLERHNIAQGIKEREAQGKGESATGESHAGPHHAAHHEQVNYEDHTVAELKEMASSRGVEIQWDARKDEIIKALEKDDKKHH